MYCIITLLHIERGLGEMEIIFVATHDLNIEGRVPNYSDYVIDFSENVEGVETFKNYFGTHIDKQRNGNSAKPSKFLNMDNNSFAEYLTNLTDNLDDKDLFLTITKKLTLKLHKTMKNVSRSNGLLIFVVYKIEEVYNLCIMKMEPENGVQFDPVNIQLTEINNLLPSSKTRLHKVGFFKLIEIDNDYKFMVLDKQVSEDNVSGFFITNFLEGEILIDDLRANSIISKSDKNLLEIVREIKSETTLDELESIKVKFESLFFSQHEVNFSEQVENILSETLDAESAIEIRSKWVEDLTNKHGENIYFEFTPTSISRYKQVWKDEEEKISLKYDPDLENAINIDQNTDNNFITITIDKVYIKELNRS